MQNKTIRIIVGIVIAALLFYAGTQYAKVQTGTTAAPASAFAGRTGTRTGGAAGTFAGAGTAGTVVSVDSQSITIALKSGGSTIVFYGTTTPMTKTDAATINDIQTGSNITVTGTANSDGSISAQSIRVEPSMTAATQ